MNKSVLHPSGSVYANRPGGTVVAAGWVDSISLGWVDGLPNETAFHQSVIEFNDDGSCVDDTQVKAATKCIGDARTSAKTPNGALVVVFIHGWHHNAEWNTKTGAGDGHFREFREVLKGLTLREAERYGAGGVPGGRSVIGIYIGWSGDPPGSRLRRIPGLTHLSFYDRTRVAGNIGRGTPIVKAVQEIVLATKQPLGGSLKDRPESPLIMIGHSMGALMLESAFLSLLKARGEPLVFNKTDGVRRVVDVRERGKSVYFPDLLLALNSAADSVIAKEIIAELKKRQFTKTIEGRSIRYSAPVLVSMTSKADKDTRVVWRIANILDPAHKTDGHDPSLFTHGFEFDARPVVSQPKGFVDFGQDWHSLRKPQPAQAATPSFWIDLPKRKRQGMTDQPEHERYELAPLAGSDRSHLAWVFQVPPKISESHNDIFNFRARLLIMALIQISGAVMSLATDFEDNFE